MEAFESMKKKGKVSHASLAQLGLEAEIKEEAGEDGGN
jgi:hypothetical protein